jgi:hypothetical protein
MKKTDNNPKIFDEGLIVLANPKKKKTSRNDKQEKFSDPLSPKHKKIYVNGRWQSCEHSRFIKALMIFGNNWKKVLKNLI